MSILGKHPRDEISINQEKKRNKNNLLIAFLDKHKRMPRCRETTPCLRRYIRENPCPEEITTHKYFSPSILDIKITKMRKFIKEHNRLPTYDETKPCLRRYFADRIYARVKSDHGVPNDILSRYKNYNYYEKSIKHMKPSSKKLFDKRVLVFNQFLTTHGRPPKYGETKPCSRRYFCDLTRSDPKKVPSDILKYIRASAYFCDPQKFRKNVRTYVDFMDEHKRRPRYNDTKPCCRQYFQTVVRSGGEIPNEILSHPYYNSRTKVRNKFEKFKIKSFIEEFLQKN